MCEDKDVQKLTFEAYMNKKLVTTHMIGSTSSGVLDKTRISADSTFYSPINFIGDTIKVANIQYFNAAITGTQVRTLTNKPLTIIN
jgi:hypothetical protein